jgi:hypothetical protein
LRVIALSPALEEALGQSITRTDRGIVLAIEPGRAQSMASRLPTSSPERWHNLCLCVVRRCVRTSGGC